MSISAIELWLASTLGTFTLVLIGLVLGSFLNVVIARLPLMILREDRRFMLNELNIHVADGPRFNLAVPRSQCLTCNAPIRWFNNIPLFSWFWLRGKCANCKAPISAQYPIVEAVTAIALLTVFNQFGLSLETGLKFFFYAALICIVFIDWHHRLIPDVVSLPLIAAGLLASVFSTSEYSVVSSSDAIIGLVLGFGIFALLNLCYKLITHRSGIGGGDFRLAGALGAWLGWLMLPWVLLVAALLALIYGCWLLIRGQYSQTQGIQFGSFMGLSGIALLAMQDAALLPAFVFQT